MKVAHLSILKFLPALIVVLLFYGCSGSTAPNSPVLSYSPSSFNVPDSSGMAALSIKNTGGGSLEWRLSSNAEWLSVEPASGTGNAEIEIRYKENFTGNPRTAALSIHSNGGQAEVSVTQKGKPGDDNFYLAENGVTVKCPAAEIGDRGIVKDVIYTKRNAGHIGPQNAATACTTGITDMSKMFLTYFYFNKDISSWDVSSVTNMRLMFAGVEAFNQPIGHWDVSNVTNMESMFLGAHNFNQPIGNWDVSSVTNMSEMFVSASSFNQPIGNWDVSNVTDMGRMFWNASSFNQPIGNWDVSNVTDMELMFRRASSFNQSIGSWDVSNVTGMDHMFHDASSFNQPTGHWDVSNVTDMDYMFAGAKSFSQDISGWCVSLIETEPENFSTGSPLTEEHEPVWGTCPE